MDCDGITSEDDCDDNNVNLRNIDNDADCDGIQTEDDCDDSDPELSEANEQGTCTNE